MHGGTSMSVFIYVCQYVSVRVSTIFFPPRQGRSLYTATCTDRISEKVEGVEESICVTVNYNLCVTLNPYASMYRTFTTKTMKASSGERISATNSLASPQASRESTKGASREPGIYCNGPEFMEMRRGTPCQARGAVIIEVNLQ